MVIKYKYLHRAKDFINTENFPFLFETYSSWNMSWRIYFSKNSIKYIESDKRWRLNVCDTT